MKAFKLSRVLVPLAFICSLSTICQAQTDGAIKPTGSFYGLIIGESQYDNPKLVLDRPAKDAQKFRDLIISKYSFDDKNVKLLLNPSGGMTSRLKRRLYSCFTRW